MNEPEITVFPRGANSFFLRIQPPGYEPMDALLSRRDAENLHARLSAIVGSTTSEDARLDAFLPSPILETALVETISSDDAAKIQSLIRGQFRTEEFNERVLRLVKNILTQLYKSLYTRRSFWRDTLSTSSE